MRYIHTLLTMLLIFAATGCGDKDSFVIAGKIDGAGDRSVTLTYYAAGGLKSTTINMNSGVFQFKGSSARPTLAIVTVAPDNQRLAAVVVANGDEVRIEGALDNPAGIKVTGNSDSEALQKWMADNDELLRKGDAGKINKAVAEFVKKNSDKPVATALMVTCFRSEGYEAMADSLFTVLGQDVRSIEMTQNFNAVISSYVGNVSDEPLPFLTLYCSNDSMINVNPIRHSATLLCFVDADRKQRDSVASTLRDLTRSYDRSELAAVELSTAVDSSSWRRSISGDSARWIQAWLPGSVSATPVRRLDVNRIPYFIVADSAGRTIYRGPSIGQARRFVDKQLKRSN